MNITSTSFSIIYTKAAVARIFDTEIENITRFEIWANVCLIHIANQRPTFVSKKLLKQHFVDYRIKRSKP